jgi:hypothetical protein
MTSSLGLLSDVGVTKPYLQYHSARGEIRIHRVADKGQQIRPAAGHNHTKIYKFFLRTHPLRLENHLTVPSTFIMSCRFDLLLVLPVCGKPWVTTVSLFPSLFSWWCCDDDVLTLSVVVGIGAHKKANGGLSRAN